MYTTPEYIRPVIGISCGDLNGIGLELIIKTVTNSRILDLCTPILFASNKAINFYRKSLPENNFNFQVIKEFTRINPKQVNVFSCWEEDVAITPGQLTEAGGKYAVLSLTTAVQALKNGHIQGLVTAPINKKNTQSEEFPYTGHTPYLKAAFEAKEVVMMMVASNMRVALLTEHVPVTAIGPFITKANIVTKLKLVEESLVKDFGIEKPKIAVLGLNPHAGDEGLIGNEEETIIKPAIKEFKHQGNSIVQGPFSADAFFARGFHEKFDAVLAMYHDQGLIPFKSLAHGEGVNFTGGLPIVRTSPDHGTAFDIAGKNKADESSMYAAIFTCVDIIRQRAEYAENRKNPLKKVTNRLLANAVDERIDLD
ncbi:4-hydroxythreonine-4-phosphate dehydrogenase PdxA [Flavihumibacter profundi]|jgi:4-hydroxythreonine-4-phosphate dehydrogenase|uniref:4-hydroxythreonine-4-phosphate dehydrogenase PdxA n=1 Tax=Flavihumibacter profundi TaxID=2716883 RepID=UPI001CC5643F|nr:4-hydroxythreonine-4-phosphate dehydrogenase PdxA [Flavihumibacter profundi]MBZ5858111.1 4-hydroxythreonine-4-phosphate dehydrogenase PdxA [Flavihumibacter profundi]